ncbi:MAG: Putative thiosulfate sulfurtransferase SseA [uncultured Sulfurimonas sp.]|nr:MAG: Putative thiosulfate sulfurtransferase SseA [uncultured Sulfurimonas sp.]
MQLNGKLTDPFTMQKIVQNLGLNADDKLVIYDNGSFFDAARLLWALEVYGFKDVKLLNAGYKQWSNKKFETSTQIPTVSKSDYVTIINNNRLATKFTTQIATRNPNQIIIDARPDKAYKGHVSSAKRKGHIPKALNIPANHNIDTDNKSTTLKDLSQLKDLYKDIAKKKKIILYCAIGKISATNYFALCELGYNVSNYDASWREWGNDLKLPVINLQETK